MHAVAGADDGMERSQVWCCTRSCVLSRSPVVCCPSRFGCSSAGWRRDRDRRTPTLAGSRITRTEREEEDEPRPCSRLVVSVCWAQMGAAL
jgi:hypothetical protein